MAALSHLTMFIPTEAASLQDSTSFETNHRSLTCLRN